MAVVRHPFDGSERANVVHTPSTEPQAGTAVGRENDIAITYTSSTSTLRAKLARRFDGQWGAGISNYASDGVKIALPIRSVSMQAADLIPGWSWTPSTAVATGTVPADVVRLGTFGGAWYTSSAGTRAGLNFNRTGVDMAFFSGSFQITTLPESGRFFWFGQFATSGTDIYGYGIRIESTGAVTLRVIDPFSAIDSALDSGMTVVANDSVLVERFGFRMSAYKTATTGREWLGPENATATARPLNARVGSLSGGDGYAKIFATNAMGLITDSASVRVSDVGFIG